MKLAKFGRILKDQRGYNHLAHMLILLVLLSIVSGAGVLVSQAQKDEPNDQKTTTTTQSTTTTQIEAPDPAKPAIWTFDGKAWRVSGTPAACNKQLLTVSPLNMSQVTGVGYPGQSRGGVYQTDGTLALANAANVVLPVDAVLTEGLRYTENGEVHYLLDFTNSCGLGIRFDHLSNLNEVVQQLVDKSLPPAQGATSTLTAITGSPIFKAGDNIAAANGALTFGLYDYRTPNASSRLSSYKPTGVSPAQANYAVCWVNELPPDDRRLVQSLPATDQQAGKTSDYCK